MGDYYGGLVNQQMLKKQLGFDGKVNPVAIKSGRRDLYARSLAIRELEQFVRRYEWKNLPEGLDATLIERILYYRGRLVLFEYNGTFYSLPFALNGVIDVYGRYKTVTPLTFNGSIVTDDDGNQSMGDGEWISGLELNVYYGSGDIATKSGVILNDYTQGMSEFIIPRYQINHVYHEDLANIVILIRHNLISSARVYTLRVNDEGQYKAVMNELNDMETDILEGGKRVFPITAVQKLEEILQDKKLETQQYWEAYVSQDNLRENLMGIENNGIFKKKERQLKGEQELEASSADLVYEDGLFNRRQFAERVNILFGTNIEVVESAVIQGVEELPQEEVEEEVVEE